jgi:probable HAF family extracellular repeat protein
MRGSVGRRTRSTPELILEQLEERCVPSLYTLAVPGAYGTFAEGINNSGQIVGSYDAGGQHYHGFLLNQGSYTTLDPPGSSPSFFGLTGAHGINDSGQIVGVLPESLQSLNR